VAIYKNNKEISERNIINMQHFFTADTHFGHKNILKHCNLTRGSFESIKQHDELIISNWNSKISKGDVVYHLGDFCLGSRDYIVYLSSQLNGQIHLLRGNHDKGISGHIINKFIFVKDYHEVSILNKDTGRTQKIVLCHYPFASWKNSIRGSWCLHGHCHGRLAPINGRLDVGVDSHNFYPLSFEDITTIMAIKSQNNGIGTP